MYLSLRRLRQQRGRNADCRLALQASRLACKFIGGSRRYKLGGVLVKQDVFKRTCRADAEASWPSAFQGGG